MQSEKKKKSLTFRRQQCQRAMRLYWCVNQLRKMTWTRVDQKRQMLEIANKRSQGTDKSVSTSVYC